MLKEKTKQHKDMNNMRNKILMTLALLLTAVGGAWAQSTEPTEWDLTSQDGKAWTLAKMPASGIELQVEYYPESNLFLGKEALADKANIAVKNGETAVEFDDAGKSTTTVSEGNKVTATYSGTRKVKSVKAVKKGGAAGIVNPVVGQIIGSDGKNYDATATLPDGVTAVAMIAYVGNDAETSTTYNHGLALALSDADTKTWCSQTDATCLGTQYDSNKFEDLAGIANTDALVNHTGHTHDAANAARGYNGGTHPTGTSAWFLPSAGQWDKMATAAIGNLKTNAGLQESARYWSSTERTARGAWYFDSGGSGSWASSYKYDGRLVRACLAFDIAEWDLTSEDGKTWTLDKMPGSDIELQVEYYAESNIFLGKEALADKANIAVKNGETAVAFDDNGKSTTTVSEGNTVTATYTGTKKVIGMTVTKRVSLVYPITISEVTDEAYIGSVVTTDGYVYATLDDVDNASKTAVARICYVGSETGDATYNHGLALALSNVSDTKQWCPASKKCLDSQYTTVAEAKGDLAGIANTDALVGHAVHTHAAASAARGYNSGTHPDGTSEWFLPSVGQWDKMATAVGDYENLGLNLGTYWSSTEVDADNAWSLNGGSWSNDKKYYNQGIRACLAF